MLGALDAGAHGILVPLLESVDDAKKLVEAAKYPPLGKRGFGCPFAMESFGDISMTDYFLQANDGLVTAVQIETQGALDSVSTPKRIFSALCKLRGERKGKPEINTRIPIKIG